MPRVQVSRSQRLTCLVIAICVAFTGLMAPAASRDDSFAFAAPRIKKVAAVHPRLAGAGAGIADAAPDAKQPKRLKVAAPPANRLYQPAAAPLPDDPIVINGHGYLPLPVYTGLRTGAEAVMTQLPPETHFYIGVGRSPTSLVTFLSLLAPGGAISFPASGLSGGISPHHVAEFDRHIEALIPPEAFTSGKTLVLMDTVSGGGSLRAMRDRVAAYSLKKYGKPVNMALLGLGGTASGITHVVKNLEFLKAGKDDIAPYLGEHKIGRDTLEQLPGKQNPGHAAFRSALAQRMVRDDALDTFINDGYRRLVRLTPTVARIGMIKGHTAYGLRADAATTELKKLLAAEITAQRVQPARPGEELRMRVRFDPAVNSMVLESNLATLDPAFTHHLANVVYEAPGAPPWDLDITAKLSADGKITDPTSIVIARTPSQTKVHGRMTPLRHRIRFVSTWATMTARSLAEAQDEVVRVLGRIPWDAAPGAKVRIVMTPEKTHFQTPITGLTVAGNVDLKWLTLLQHAPFEPFLRGPTKALPHVVEIEATLDKHGRVSARSAVTITRQLAVIPPKEFSGKARTFAAPRARFNMQTPAQATAAAKELLAAALANVAVGGGKPQTAHVRLRPAREKFSSADVALTTLPRSLQPLLEAGELPELMAIMSDGGATGMPRDVDIEIRFGADGKLAGQEAIEVTFPLRELKRQPKVVRHGSLHYEALPYVTTKAALGALRAELAHHLQHTRVDATTSPVVIEVTKAWSQYGGKLWIDSNLPKGLLGWLSNQAPALSRLADGEWNLMGKGGEPVPGTLRIEIVVAEDGQLRLDSSMRLLRLNRAIPFKQPHSAALTNDDLGQKRPAKHDGVLRALARELAASWNMLTFEGGAKRAFTVKAEPLMFRRAIKITSNLPPELRDAMALGRQGALIKQLVSGDGTQPPRPLTFQIQLDDKGQIAGESAVRIEPAK